MRRTARHRLWLCCGAAVLVALGAWQWRLAARTAPGTLLTRDPADIRHVAIGFQGHRASHFARRDGHWWHTDGTPRPADDGRLDELARLAAAPVIRWRPAHAFDPARIGLAPPSAVLTLDGETLEFGGTAAIGPMNYVRVGDRIALVSVRDTPRPARADAVETH